jgi:uncharacterized protein YndB with AHSA1/START domain
MAIFSSSIEISAPPERVWPVLIDVERWPEWTPTMISVRRVDAGPLAVGSRARVRQPKLPPAVWQVTELVPGRSFTWISGGIGVRVVARHTVEASSTGGSRATVSIQFAGPLGPLFARLTRSLNERYLALEAKGLKGRSEKEDATRG